MKFKNVISVLLVTMMLTSVISTPAVFAAEETLVPDADLETAEEPEQETQEQEVLEPAAEEEPVVQEETAEEPEQTDESETEEKVQIQSRKTLAATIDIKPVLKAKAVKNKAFKNTSGKFKVKFTATWSDKDKYKELVDDGWTFTYRLYDQSGNVLEKKFDYSKGFVYAVKAGNTKYKLVATAKKSGEKSQKLESSLMGKFKFPKKSAKLNAKCPKSTNNVTLKWKKVDNASYYYIYRSTKKKAPSKPFERVTKTKYVDENLAGKKNYYYFVQAVYTGNKSGKEYVTASGLTGPAKVTVQKYATCDVRPIAWYSRIHRNTTLYKSYKGNASKGSLKKGQRVFITKKYPKKFPYGQYPKRVFVQVKSGSGKVKKSGWVRYADASGIAAQVTYIASKKLAYDWTKETKEDYVNKKKFASKTKYLIWVSTYTQRVNIFKGKKGHWKLIRTHRCVTGKFLHQTEITTHNQIEKRKPKRIRTFYQKTSKYWYSHLSFFEKWNAFHTVCWYLGTKKPVNSIKSNLQPGTRGCVRCFTNDAIWIYNHIPLKTRVIIY